MRLMQQTDDEIARIMLQAAKDLEKIIGGLPGKGVGAMARRAMYIQRQQQIYQVLAETWRGKVPTAITQGLSTSTQMAVNAQRRMLYLLSKATPEYAAILRDSMLHSAAATFADMRSRVLNGVNLSPSVYRNEALSRGTIDRIVNNGIALGQSAREIADAVVGYINPSTPGGAKYAAQRLGRTELNNAFRTTSAMTYAESPYVTGVQWTLSGSHPGDDDCDALAEIDEYGLGDGVFPSDEVPDSPHPNCFCYLVPITPTQEEFQEQLLNGEYDCAGV
jgi:hypothetical protein